MTTPDAFRRAIWQERGNDDLRTAFADWLEDHGGEGYAEFVRCQLELARIRNHPAFRKLATTLAPQLGRVTEEVIQAGIESRDDVIALRARERELLDGVLGLGIDALPVIDGLARSNCVGRGGYGWYRRGGTDQQGGIEATFRRGFVAEVALSWQDWLDHHDAILDAAPLERVVLTTYPDIMDLYRLARKHGFGESPGNRIVRHMEIITAEWPRIAFDLSRVRQPG